MGVMENNPKIRVVNTHNGKDNQIRLMVWNNMRKDKDGDTRGGGWRVISDIETAEIIKKFT